MKLLTAEIKKALPPLYSNEEKRPEDTPVIVKFFNPTGIGTWYVTEFDGEDIMFGLCVLHEPELGYVSFAELDALRVPPFGLKIERDLHWHGTLADAMKAENYGR